MQLNNYGELQKEKADTIKQIKYTQILILINIGVIIMQLPDVNDTPGYSWMLIAVAFGVSVLMGTMLNRLVYELIDITQDIKILDNALEYVVAIKFLDEKKARRRYYFNTHLDDLTHDELVIVLTENGEVVARVDKYVDLDQFDYNHPTMPVINRVTNY